jgi:hypothetical protein
MVGVAEDLVRQRVQGDLSADRGQREGTLRGGDGLVMLAHAAEMV